MSVSESFYGAYDLPYQLDVDNSYLMFHFPTDTADRFLEIGPFNPFTPSVKPWVIQTFDSMDGILKCDHSLEKKPQTNKSNLVRMCEGLVHILLSIFCSTFQM